MKTRKENEKEEVEKEKNVENQEKFKIQNHQSLSFDEAGSDLDELYCSMKASIFSTRHSHFRPNSVLSVAPMMEWTDRHFRYMMRKITRETLLYTEMVVDSTLIHQTARLNYFLGHHTEERPLAVQIGGSDPTEVSEAAYICESFGGFESINLNCGCPSKRVSKRCFGARLMLDPEKVARITYEMMRKTSRTPITVKCRIGADNLDRYEDLVNFVHTVSRTGVREFIIHARKCFLNGLSAAQNRTVPPLQYPLVHQLGREFPELYFSINGGITSLDQARQHLRLDTELICNSAGFTSTIDDQCLSHKESHANIDDNIGIPSMYGVMIGRAAYNNPWQFRYVDSMFYGKNNPQKTRREVIEEYLDYAEKIIESQRDSSDHFKYENAKNGNSIIDDTSSDNQLRQEKEDGEDQEDEEEMYYREINENRKVKSILKNTDGKVKTFKHPNKLDRNDGSNVRSKKEDVEIFGASPTYLIKPLHFLFNGIPYSHDFKRHLATQVDWKQVKRDHIPLTDIVLDAMGNLWNSPLLDET